MKGKNIEAKNKGYALISKEFKPLNRVSKINPS
jgi:hypothetical protein